ncbi:MAG: hypothetical protein KC646_17510 [Candidatus Cloacimonetes bacterium]|nr:hypothetical protein [Candidatus Cloacimonadota bacterium]
MKNKTCNSCHEEFTGLGCEKCVIHKKYFFIMLAVFVLAIVYYFSLLFYAPQPDHYFQTTTIIWNECDSRSPKKCQTHYLDIKHKDFQSKKVYYRRHNHKVCKSTKLYGETMKTRNSCQSSPQRQVLKTPRSTKKDIQRHFKYIQDNKLQIKRQSRMQLKTDGGSIEL